MEPFALPVETMRARRGIKWKRYDEAVLPAFVADMDFAVAEPVQSAVRRIVDQQDYGYYHREDRDGLESAFADRMRERFGWEASPERTLPITDLLRGIAAATVGFSEPGYFAAVLGRDRRPGPQARPQPDGGLGLTPGRGLGRSPSGGRRSDACHPALQPPQPQRAGL